MSGSRELDRERYLAALRRQRERVAAGLPLVQWDDTTPGSKDTEHSWGLCSRDLHAWPDREDWTWPDREPEPTSSATRSVDPPYGTARVYGIKTAPDGCQCPFDRDDNPAMKGMSWGCFYRCRFFSPRGPVPDRDEAVRLYDLRIAEAARGV